MIIIEVSHSANTKANLYWSTESVWLSFYSSETSFLNFTANFKYTYLELSMCIHAKLMLQFVVCVCVRVCVFVCVCVCVCVCEVDR